MTIHFIEQLGLLEAGDCFYFEEFSIELLVARKGVLFVEDKSASVAKRYVVLLQKPEKVLCNGKILEDRESSKLLGKLEEVLLSEVEEAKGSLVQEMMFGENDEDRKSALQEFLKLRLHNVDKSLALVPAKSSLASSSSKARSKKVSFQDRKKEAALNEQDRERVFELAINMIMANQGLENCKKIEFIKESFPNLAHIAVISNNVKALSDLLGLGCNIDAVVESSPYSLILSAIKKGKVECFHLLLFGGANLDYVDKERNTLLHLAAAQDDGRIYSSLCEVGLNENAINSAGKTPKKIYELHEEKRKKLESKKELESAIKNNKDIAEELPKAGLEKEDLNYLLRLAAIHGRVNCVEPLFKAGADFSAQGGAATDIVEISQRAKKYRFYKAALAARAAKSYDFTMPDSLFEVLAKNGIQEVGDGFDFKAISFRITEKNRRAEFEIAGRQYQINLGGDEFVCVAQNEKLTCEKIQSFEKLLINSLQQFLKEQTHESPPAMPLRQYMAEVLQYNFKDQETFKWDDLKFVINQEKKFRDVLTIPDKKDASQILVFVQEDGQIKRRFPDNSEVVLSSDEQESLKEQIKEYLDSKKYRSDIYYQAELVKNIIDSDCDGIDGIKAISNICEILDQQVLDQKSLDALMHIAASEGSLEALELMIEKGAQINSCNLNQNSALHLVAQIGDMEKYVWLIDNGANTEARNKEGKTAYECIQADSPQTRVGDFSVNSLMVRNFGSALGPARSS